MTLLFALVLAFNGVAFSWGTTGGDGSNYGQLQETAVFYNNSGRTLTAGEVVVLDLDGSGVSCGTTLGAYVDVISAADARSVMGVVKSTSAANGSPVVVVTKGPVKARSEDDSDPVTAGSAVGTTTTPGCMGGGTKLGYALDSGNGSEGQLIWIWVDTHNSE